MPFQIGHGHFKGAEKGWFKKGQTPSNKGKSRITIKACKGCKREMLLFTRDAYKYGWCSYKCKRTTSKLVNFKDKPCPDCGKLIQRISRKCKSCANLGRKRPEISGVNNNNWKGGISLNIMGIRRSSQYKFWARKVKERDNYTCVFCGARGVYLHSDHIKGFADYPELRFDLSNGRTLCVPCHKLTPNYGRQKGTVMPK